MTNHIDGFRKFYNQCFVIVVISLLAISCGSVGSDDQDIVEPDSINPVVLDVRGITENGLYGVNSVISFSVKFSERVFVTGVPRIVMQQSIRFQAQYVSGSGTDLLRFGFTVRPGDLADDLSYFPSSPIILSSATIKDAAGNDSEIGLPIVGEAGSLSFNSDIVIDGELPGVNDVQTQSENGTYNTGDTILFSVVFSEPITVMGSPALILETGDVDAVAPYTGIDGNTLFFEYLVDDNHTSPHLYPDSLLVTDTEIHDAAGNSVNRYMKTSGSDEYAHLPPRTIISVYDDSFLQINPESGPVDNTYGHHGRSVVQAPSNFHISAFSTIKQDPNTLMCAVGFGLLTVLDQYVCARINSIGDIDSTYGTGGLLTVPKDDLVVNHLALHEDGKMLVARIPSLPDDAACRYLTDATLDISFNNGGCVIETGDVRVSALSVQENGQVLIAWRLQNTTLYRIYRYNYDGTVDSTLGSSTTDYINIDAGNIDVQAVSVQDDGKILVAGPSRATSSALIGRFLNDGQPDATFAGSRDFVSVSTGTGSQNIFHDVRQLPDGSIVAIGESQYRFLVTKLLSQGDFDTSFGQNGTITTSPWLERGRAEIILVESDGSFIVVGYSFDSIEKYFVAIKYL